VRELENLIEHAFVLCHGSQIGVEHLPVDFVKKLGGEKVTTLQVNILKDAEAKVIIETLKKWGGNRAKAAQELGIDKSTLWRKMKTLNIENL
jgi:DNA-binding NtrC family response regulator